MPRGRPRRPNAARYENGRLRPAQQPEAPAARLNEFQLRDVVQDGQVVAQAYRRIDFMEAVACNRTDGPSVDGDQWWALLEYADAWLACTVSGRSCLDMTPSGGGGMEAQCDARRPAETRHAMLRAAVPPHLVGLLDRVCVNGVPPADVASMHGVTLRAVYAKLGEAADCLMVAIGGHRRAA